MNTLRVWKVLTLGALFLASLLTGVPAAQAQDAPVLNLSISTGNWTNQAGTWATVSFNGIQYWDQQISYSQILRWVPGKSDELTMNLCAQNQAICNTSLFVPVGGMDFQGKLVYKDGRTYVTPHYTLYGTSNSLDQTAPSISLSVLPSATGNNQYATLLATATDNKSAIQAIRIVRVDNGQKSTEKVCNFQNYCNFEYNVNFNIGSGDIGRSIWYEAQAMDTAYNVGYSPRVSVNVVPFYPSPLPVNPAPVYQPIYQPYSYPYVDTYSDTSALQEDKTTTVYGEAYNQSGLWGIEVRALPSWSTETITKRCVYGAGTTSATCNLTVGPFKGHAGQNIQVWTLAWDAKYGYGNSSYSRTIAIVPSPKMNYNPKVTITPSTKTALSNQKISWKVTASDENGIARTDIYVNAQIVKTCAGTTVCEYAGPTYSKYAGSSVSYAAKVWDKTGKFTWTGYEYVKINKK